MSRKKIGSELNYFAYGKLGKAIVRRSRDDFPVREMKYESALTESQFPALHVQEVYMYTSRPLVDGAPGTSPSLLPSAAPAQ